MKRTEALKNRPLTIEEQRFAEKNHDTVYRFLRWNHYPIEEYYTVVIEQYLKACQIYLERVDLQKYTFSTIAWKHMQSAVGNYRKAERAQKRYPEHGTVSLDDMISEEYRNTGRCYAEVIVDVKTDIVYSIIQNEEDKVFMGKLWFFLSERQMEIVLFKMDGFKDTEIYRHYGLKRKDYQKEMENIREILGRVLDIG